MVSQRLRWREKGGEVIAGTVSCEVIIGILSSESRWTLGSSETRTALVKVVIDRNFDRRLSRCRVESLDPFGTNKERRDQIPTCQADHIAALQADQGYHD
jgi:hypothetical protein